MQFLYAIKRNYYSNDHSNHKQWDSITSKCVVFRMLSKTKGCECSWTSKQKGVCFAKPAATPNETLKLLHATQKPLNKHISCTLHQCWLTAQNSTTVSEHAKFNMAWEQYGNNVLGATGQRSYNAVVKLLLYYIFKTLLHCPWWIKNCFDEVLARNLGTEAKRYQCVIQMRNLTTVHCPIMYKCISNWECVSNLNLM